MRLEKHVESLREVIDEVRSALEDPRGVVSHQRRLAMMLSVGICDLIEIYFHKTGIMREGAKIKHDWFRKRNLKERLSNQITSPLDAVKNINKILELARDVEEKRNDLAYGSPVNNEDILKDKINVFFDIKSLIEKEVGDLIETK